MLAVVIRNPMPRDVALAVQVAAEVAKIAEFAGNFRRTETVLLYQEWRMPEETKRVELEEREYLVMGANAKWFVGVDVGVAIGDNRTYKKVRQINWKMRNMGRAR